MAIAIIDSPLGNLKLVSENGVLLELEVVDEEITMTTSSFLLSVVEELKEYFAGKRKSFSFPFKIQASEFAEKVYLETAKIPYGETKTYGEIAKAIGSQAYRAIGKALKRNKLLLVVPCHRVVSQNGLGGFLLGTKKKEWLLSLEAREKI